MRYWIGVASREHVKRGVAGGFAQVCHGKGGPLKQMTAGDWIVYYSPTERFGEKMPCRKWTALGKIGAKEPYLFKMSDDFIPWRRDVAFVQIKEAAIEPMIDTLSFIRDKRRWGFPFRRGCFAIEKKDFLLIASSMEVELSDAESEL
ncbi:MAG: EVE domain-containing protein [Verrucomicrobia bacterium]|nr:EVE domain-containing protein [Verrucomicrobiota bacterium]